MATKLFLADGVATLDLDFDAGSGDAEFRMEDEDHGNRVVEELSNVLW